MVLNRALVLLLSACLLAASCTTLRSVPLPPPDSQDVPRLWKGDRVRITLQDGHRSDLTVEAVASDHLTGRADEASPVQRIDYARIRTIRLLQQREPMSTKRKVVTAGLVVLGATVLVLATLTFKAIKGSVGSD